jgi:hypothetical protein
MNNNSRRVVRGASWSALTRFARAVCRSAFDPSFRHLNLGLRFSRRSS